MIKHPGEMKTETRENMRGGHGTITVSHYFQKEEFEARTRLCAKLTIPPGAGIGSHQHEGEDEVYIIIAGTGVLDDGESRSRVSEGDAVLTGKGASHAIENDGTVDLVLVAVIMGY